MPDTTERRLTEKGQVTIPVDIRRRLKLGPRDRVRFVVDDERVVLERVEPVVDKYYGFFKGGDTLPEDAREARIVIETAMAEEIIKETESE